MKERAIWFAMIGLLLLALVSVAWNLMTLANIKTGATGFAPEDVLGYGIWPVWVTIGMLLGALLLFGRNSLQRSHVSPLIFTLFVLFIADWATYSKLLSSMGL